MTPSLSTSTSSSNSGSTPSSLSAFPPPRPSTKSKPDPIGMAITVDDIKETAKSFGIKLTVHFTLKIINFFKGGSIRGKKYVIAETDKKKVRQNLFQIFLQQKHFSYLLYNENLSQKIFPHHFWPPEKKKFPHWKHSFNVNLSQIFPTRNIFFIVNLSPYFIPTRNIFYGEFVPIFFSTFF